MVARSLQEGWYAVSKAADRHVAAFSAAEVILLVKTLTSEAPN